MKRILTIGLLAGIFYMANAQVNNQYNLYYEDLYSINPSAIALRSSFSASMNTMISNAGFEGSPTLFNLAVGGGLAGNMGIGTRFHTNRQGGFQANSWLASYGYRLKLGESGHFLAMGLSAGIYWQNFNPANIEAVRLDDPVLESSYYRKQHFMNELGITYRWNDLTVGFSAPFVVQLYNHYMGHVSYAYDIPTVEGLAVQPFVLYQYLPEGTSQVDASVKVSYKNLWTAIGYRSNNNVLAALGVHYRDYRLAYSYEFNNQELSHIASSTHEIMFTYDFSLDLEFEKKRASYDKEQLPWQEEN